MKIIVQYTINEYLYGGVVYRAAIRVENVAVFANVVARAVLGASFLSDFFSRELYCCSIQ